MSFIPALPFGVQVGIDLFAGRRDVAALVLPLAQPGHELGVGQLGRRLQHLDDQAHLFSESYAQRAQ